MSVYNNFRQIYYQEFRPLTDVFIYPPYLCSAPILLWETAKT